MGKFSHFFDTVLPQTGYDFAVTEDCVLEDGAEIVPRAVVKACVERISRSMELFGKPLLSWAKEVKDGIFQKYGEVPLYSLSNIPCKEYPYDASPAWAASFGSDYLKLVPHHLIKKVSDLINEQSREEYAKLGITLLSQPKDALTEHGLLQIKYLRDASHTMAEYGRLVIEQILKPLGLI